MNIKDMRYLVTIAEEKCISKAAQQLYIAQSSLSQCVQKIENEYDVKLFERKKYGIEITLEGKCFLESIKKILMEHTDMISRIKDIQNSDSGSLTIGVPINQSCYIIPKVLTRCKEMYPNVSIKLIEGTSVEIEEQLVHGDINLGILHKPIISHNLSYEEFEKDRFVVLLRKNSPLLKYTYYKENEKIGYIDIKKLDKEPMALTFKNQRTRMICDEILRKANINPNIIQESRNIETLRILSSLGYASTMIPEKGIDDKKIKDEYYLIEDEYNVDYTFVVAYRNDYYLSNISKSLIKLLKNNIE